MASLSIERSPEPLQVHSQKELAVDKTGWKTLYVYYGKKDHLVELSENEVFSQAKQDEYILSMLSNKKGGFFVDLAANDATFLSNSYKLERDHGWNGSMCIYIPLDQCLPF